MLEGRAQAGPCTTVNLEEPPIDRIPIYKALMETEEIEAAEEALRRGWLGMGSYVGDFERAVEKALGGSRLAVAVSTGYAALHLPLITAGRGPGHAGNRPPPPHPAALPA